MGGHVRADCVYNEIGSLFGDLLKQHVRMIGKCYERRRIGVFIYLLLAAQF